MTALRDATFRALLKAEGLPQPIGEYEFHATREWRFDYFWPEADLALEVDGAIYARKGGRHNRGRGFEDDQEKRNAAAVYGYRTMSVMPENLTGQAFIRTLREALLSGC